ncbi:hypothetical protein [Actinoplanes awajinensis]|uniref:Uncharacterized protein n=1 Tax=Actinoplanes awajinensis subsp. mycoplanecinus TaxID=135947 RepID=A0A0X3V8T8_9ACTN|nr:hypothetical protein [Actinoplanes awajinensis]KUL41201.1 hypothetical protein ADL15_05215 [Actinoplanes awajinensis subsp. mycoplanecinus]
MRWWGRAECPVRQVEQDWIETSLDWLVAEFGTGRLRGTVVLPTDDFFPGDYRGGRDDIRAVLGRLCGHMGVDPARVELEHYAGDTEPELAAHVPMSWSSQGAAGHHRVRDGRSIIGIQDEQAAAPTALVATIAHELGHVLLLADGRVRPDRRDHEPLTDLLTVFFGLGIFGANAAFEFSRGENSYRTSRLGYLTEPMFGYALARYAWLRGETEPAWARYLDTNPRTFMKRGLRYLAQA